MRNQLCIRKNKELKSGEGCFMGWHEIQKFGNSQWFHFSGNLIGMGETKNILTDFPTSQLLSPKKVSKCFSNSGALLVRISSNACFWGKNETQRCTPRHKHSSQQNWYLGGFLWKRKLKSEKGGSEIIWSDPNFRLLSVLFGGRNVLTSNSGLIQQTAVI